MGPGSPLSWPNRTSAGRPSALCAGGGPGRGLGGRVHPGGELTHRAAGANGEESRCGLGLFGVLIG